MTVQAIGAAVSAVSAAVAVLLAWRTVRQAGADEAARECDRVARRQLGDIVAALGE
jgi:hypothetical protein